MACRLVRVAKIYVLSLRLASSASCWGCASADITATWTLLSSMVLQLNIMSLDIIRCQCCSVWMANPSSGVLATDSLFYQQDLLCLYDTIEASEISVNRSCIGTIRKNLLVGRIKWCMCGPKSVTIG